MGLGDALWLLQVGDNEEPAWAWAGAGEEAEDDDEFSGEVRQLAVLEAEADVVIEDEDESSGQVRELVLLAPRPLWLASASAWWRRAPACATDAGSSGAIRQAPPAEVISCDCCCCCCCRCWWCELAEVVDVSDADVVVAEVARAAPCWWTCVRQCESSGLRSGDSFAN